MRYQYNCETCGRNFMEFKSVKEADNVFCCGNRSKRILVYLFNTGKDLAYNFCTDMYGGTGVQVNSKGQHLKLLKERGMADCSIKEGRQHAKFRKGIVEKDLQIKRKETAHKMTKQIQKDGLMSHVMPLGEKYLIKKEQ